MVGETAVSQREVKEYRGIEEKIKLIRGTLGQALYSRDSHSKNAPIIKSLRFLIELEEELEKLYQRQ
jgi:hypothetical protein